MIFPPNPDQCAVPENTNDQGPDTVVANLLYDEKNDKLTCESSLLDGNDTTTKNDDHDESDVKKRILHPNPVFQAFDGATSVDDLYRIAEIYVNPATYYATKSSTTSFDD